MAAQFSEGWSGTPMWQLVQQKEEQQKKELEEKKKQAGDCLDIFAEGEAWRAVIIVSRLTDNDFKDTKISGPRRLRRVQAVKDGLMMRLICRTCPEVKREEATAAKCRELHSKTWDEKDLPPEGYDVEEKQELPIRQRLARKPRGHGWQRVGDKDLFKHSQAPMAFDSAKRKYMRLDEASGAYVECPPPWEPIEYTVSVNCSSSLVGKTDEDLNAPNRPRTLLLKELIKTGAAMKHPLFFLDSPAACFVLFDGIRGGAATDWCSKHFHTKLLPGLKDRITYWSDRDLTDLLTGIYEELDQELLRQSACCWDGVSMAVGLLLGNRLVVASIGACRVLLLPPDGSLQPLCREYSSQNSKEAMRVEAQDGELVEAIGSAANAAPSVRRRVQPRDCESQAEQSTEEEVNRIVDRTADCFAVLCLSPGDAVDGKAARSAYKKLALKVHPDKVSEELKVRAKMAFERAEAAATVIETLCELDAEAMAALHRILHAAGGTGPRMSRATACSVLDVGETVSHDQAQFRAGELREQLKKLGARTDESWAYPEQDRAARALEDAVEAIGAPAREGPELPPVKATRALGLRDLKLPRPMLLAVPQVEMKIIEAPGAHHLVLLSDGAAVLSDEEVLQRVRGFSKQPKAGSLLVAADAAARAAELGAEGNDRLASCVVAVLQVQSGAGPDPAAKKAKKDSGDPKVRARHILLKHKDLKMKMDPQAHLRTKGPVTRPLAQAERELLRLKEQCTKDPSQFHLLARKLSECSSALQPGQLAGDMGWISRGALGDPAFEDAILALEVHAISDLFTTCRGVHIVQRYA